MGTASSRAQPSTRAITHDLQTRHFPDVYDHPGDLGNYAGN